MLALLTIALGFCAGCDQQNVVAEEANADGATPAAVDLSKGDLAPPALADADADADADVIADDQINTNVPPKMVLAAEVPDNMKLSPPLKEVVKLVQAGVSEDVIVTYVTKEKQAYGIGSDEIVYLNDLGVSTEVLTALMQHDTAAKAGAQPPPPEVAATPPPANVAPPLPPNNANPPAIATPPLTPPASDPAYAATVADAPTTPYFYNSLAPYGNWVEVDGYGLCWQPTVAVIDNSWRPYCERGRWLWTDAGWYWYSDYSWGWAPFHYGRWCSYPRLGWIWVPGSVWGPSWVTWRFTDGYCGWAPLPPFCEVVVGRGLWYRGHAVSASFHFPGLHVTAFPFIPIPFLGNPLWRQHVVAHTEARALYTRSTVINNYTVRNNVVINNGMPHDRVVSMGARVPQATLVDAKVPSTRTNIRAEQIAHRDSSMVVTRPRLAAETTPAATPPRTEPRRTGFASTTPTGGGTTAIRTAPSSRVTSGTGYGRTAPTLPGRPQTTVDSRGDATATPRTEPRAATPRPYRTQPATPTPGTRSFSEAKNTDVPASALNQQHSAPSFSSGGKVTPLPPPASSPANSGSRVNQNPSVPSTARPVTPPAFYRSESQSSLGRSVAGSQPPVTSTPGAVQHSEPSRSFDQPAPRYVPPSPPMNVAPTYRTAPAAPPAVSAPPARSYSAPAAAPSAPARSYSTAPARSEGGNSGGGGGRGRGARD